MKLIHSGKVLKDSETIADCQLKPNAFLVVMISKAKKKTAVASTPAPAPVLATEAPKTPAPTPAAPDLAPRLNYYLEISPRFNFL